jgi:pimeloyl-ACP methyl ester carboxylesterase
MKSVCLLLLVSGAAAAGALQAPSSQPPSADERREIEHKLSDLSGHIEQLAAAHVDPALLADVDIYRKAVEYILRFPEEFAGRGFVADTFSVLDTGLARARELEHGTPSWPHRKGHVVRGYRSRIDGSVQPYALTIPDSYDGSTPLRLDIWQHGTDRTMNEIAFITRQEHGRPVPDDQNFIQLEPLGRTNVSYRWAGEADLFEALASVEQRYKIDPKRIVLRGFSMGGASSWHLGLHHPGRWAAIEAGAGYTETRRYGRRDNLTPVQEATLHYYDAVDYALNAFNTPTVGYGGEIDAQLQASVNIREQLMKEGFRFQQDGPYRWNTTDLRALFLIGPNTAHAWHPGSKAESNEFIARALKAADTVPAHVRFVTYTTRFNKAHWLTVEGLEETYKRADVDAHRSLDGTSFTVTTRNVARLAFDTPPATFTLDGQRLKAGANPSFERKNGKWAAAVDGKELRKVHALQGPIDDAFMDAFVCVAPTGSPWHAAVQDWTKKTAATFRADFAKWLRGDVRLKEDRAISASDIADHNLVLFGDPGSNALIADVIGKLPVRWTKDAITIGTRTFSAADHVLTLIYPNPLNPKRYVVINSGHTFGEADFRGTNAWLYPRLGDYAVLTTEGEVALSGLFDDRWQLNK